MIFEKEEYYYGEAVNQAVRKSRITGPTPYSGLGKLPPQATDLEEVVLGALMLERDALPQVIEFLRPEMFYEPRHERVYRCVNELFKKGSPVDIMTVTAGLRGAGELEMIGGAYYITELTNRVASAGNIEYYARIIQQKFIQRELIRMSTEVIQTAYEDTTDVLDLLDMAQTQLSMLSDEKSGNKTSRIGSLITQRQADYRTKPENGLTGISSGLRDLDDKTNGWQNSDLIIVGARPAMGKTAFVLNVARNAAVDHKKKVLVFSLEMSGLQLTDRLIARESHILQDTILKRKLTDQDHEDIVEKVKELSESFLFIDDTAGLNSMTLRSRAHKIKQKYGLDMIVIDYLQLMEGDKNSRGNREQDLSKISRALKKLAKELNIPIIAISQLSRDLEKRPNKQPMLSDLRESGAIEQDADAVLFLFRPEYYGLKEWHGKPTAGMALIIIAKYRQGVCGPVQADFHGGYMRFSDWGLDIPDGPEPEKYLQNELDLDAPPASKDVDGEDLPF